MFGDSNEAGLGVVIRNDKGEVMAAFAEKIPLPYIQWFRWKHWQHEGQSLL